MDRLPFGRLLGEIRTKQVQKIERAEQPDQNVTQHNFAITQTCRAIRNESRKLFYFINNSVVLNIADFKDHISPILTPPRKESYLRRDIKSAQMIKAAYHPEATIEMSAAVHLPINPESLALEGRKARPLEATWLLDGYELDEAEQRAWLLKVRDAMDELNTYYRGTHTEDLVMAMISHATFFLANGVRSFMETPFFGPALPPDMEAVRESQEREQRELEWTAQQERNREAACS